MKASEFLGKRHTIPVIWALVLMVVAFAGGQFWNWYDGSEEVIVQNVAQLNPKPNVQYEPTAILFGPAALGELVKLPGNLRVQ